MHLKLVDDLRKTWKVGQDLQKDLDDIADKLDKVRFRSNVGKVSGSATAIAGTVISVTGGVLSFFTMGASLILVIVGASVAAAGGFTATGAFVADKVVSKKILRQIESKWKEFHEDPFVKNHLGLDQHDDGSSGVRESTAHTCSEEGSGLRSTAETGAAIVTGAGRVARVADFVADASSPAVSALRVASTAGRALVITGLVLDGVLLPLTLYDLITSSLELHRKKGHPAGQRVRSYSHVLAEVNARLASYIFPPVDPVSADKQPEGIKNPNFDGSFRFV